MPHAGWRSTGWAIQAVCSVAPAKLTVSAASAAANGKPKLRRRAMIAIATPMLASANAAQTAGSRSAEK